MGSLKIIPTVFFLASILVSSSFADEPDQATYLIVTKKLDLFCDRRYNSDSDDTLIDKYSDCYSTLLSSVSLFFDTIRTQDSTLHFYKGQRSGQIVSFDGVQV